MNAILATEQRLVALADSPNLPADNAALPVSARIRARLQRAKRRFHANDNISAFIEARASSTRCWTKSRARCRACWKAW